MKKIFLSLLLAAICTLQGMAQSVFTVKNGDKTYSFPLTSEISVTDDALWTPDTLILHDTVTVAPVYRTRLKAANIDLDGRLVALRPVGDYKWAVRIPGREGHKFFFRLNVNLRQEPVPGFNTIPFFIYEGYAPAAQARLTSVGTTYAKNEGGMTTTQFETADFGADSVELVVLEDTTKYGVTTARDLHLNFYVLADSVVARVDTVALQPTYRTRMQSAPRINLGGTSVLNGTIVYMHPVADYVWAARIPGREGTKLNFYLNIYTRDEPVPGFSTIPYITHVGYAEAANNKLASAGTIYNMSEEGMTTDRFVTSDFGADSVTIVMLEDTAKYTTPMQNDVHGTYYVLADKIIGGSQVIEKHDTVSYYFYPLTVLSAADSMGTVTGSGVYRAGTQATVVATPREGYVFKNWSNGSTQASMTYTVTGIDTLTATFEKYEAPAQWSYNQMYLNVSDAATFINTYQPMTKGSTVDTWTWEGTFNNDVTAAFYSDKNYFCDYWGIANWGDPYQTEGTCKKEGGDMAIPAGTYKITFNVNRLTYTVEKK